MNAEESRRIAFHIRFNRASSLFARCWLLVEGETETWVINELARQCGHHFDAEGVKVIEFAQSGLKPLIKFARRMGIQWHVLVDGDEAGKKYAATVRGLLNNDRELERDHLTSLPALDMEHFMYRQGFDDVYHRVAQIPDNVPMNMRRVITKAIHRSSKPDLAIEVAMEAGRRGVDAVPTLLKKMFSRVLWLAIWGWRILNAPLPNYQTLVVRKGDLQQSVLATGKLDALRKVDVGAQVSGQLKTLHVNIGDKVKKDQLLGVIDPEQAQNQIKEVEATLMELRAQLNQARAESKLAQVTLARQQQLAQRQLVSRQDLDTAATDLAVKQAQIGTIEAQIKRNQATLDTAKTNLDYTRILAPMAGEVTQITTLQGQTVIAAQQAPNILTLADLSTMLVKAQVSEADVIHLRPGQKAWFTVLGDPLTRYEGKLKDILPTPEKVNDAIFYYARFEVPNPQGILRLDMTAQVHIQLAEVKNVITIPLSALGDAVGDNRYHVRLLRTGEVKEREVIIGARNDTDVAVVQGLEEGDEVIVGESASGAAK